MSFDIISCQVGLVLPDFAGKLPMVSIVKKDNILKENSFAILSFYTLIPSRIKYVSYEVGVL